MKILGTTKSGVVAEISQDEIARVFNHYSFISWYQRANDRPSLDIGETIDLGVGYDYLKDIKDACERMADAYKTFEKASNTMQQFAALLIESKE